MDTKDPVWDDDEPGLVGDGFRPSQHASSQEQELSSSANEQQDETEVPAAHIEETPELDVEPAESFESVRDEASAEADLVPPAMSEIPKPPTGRTRVEPVSGLSNPVPGGGRSSSASRRGGDRSSTALVIIALLLFVISVISVSVYFFSRPADGGGQETFDDQSTTEQSEIEQTDASGYGGQRATDAAASTADTVTPSQVPSDASAQSVPPPPAPAGSSSSGPTAQKTAASRDAARRDIDRNEVASADRVSPQSSVPKTPRPSSPERQDKGQATAPFAREQRLAQPPSEPAPPLKTSKSANATGAQWVVQVHSSQSIDDADEWLQKLQSRNVADGRIEPVTQKGSVWYRVRFGRYATRQEAEQAALEMGYRNAWVDRIR